MINIYIIAIRSGQHKLKRACHISSIFHYCDLIVVGNLDRGKLILKEETSGMIWKSSKSEPDSRGISYKNFETLLHAKQNTK